MRNRQQKFGLIALILPACLENNAHYRQPPDLADVCQPVTGMAMPGEVLVPCGTFLQGSKMNDPLDLVVQANEMPATMEFVQAFYMDQTEVTVLAYQGCVEGGGCMAPVVIADPLCNYGQSNKNQHPINCVTWDQAWAYCKWRGARLPTETEWEYAARGQAHSTYPWGNTAPVVPGADMELPQACWNNVNGNSTCQVMSYPSTLFGQPNPNGLYDLAGNVWEWTDTQLGPYPPYPPDPAFNNKDGGENTERIFRGGSFSDGGEGQQLVSALRAAFRNMAPVDYSDFRDGFRCARSAP